MAIPQDGTRRTINTYVRTHFGSSTCIRQVAQRILDNRALISMGRYNDKWRKRNSSTTHKVTRTVWSGVVRSVRRTEYDTAAAAATAATAAEPPSASPAEQGSRSGPGQPQGGKGHQHDRDSHASVGASSHELRSASWEPPHWDSWDYPTEGASGFNNADSSGGDMGNKSGGGDGQPNPN